jgi:hypothetical protein
MPQTGVAWDTLSLGSALVDVPRTGSELLEPSALCFERRQNTAAPLSHRQAATGQKRGITFGMSSVRFGPPHFEPTSIKKKADGCPPALGLFY